MSNPNQIFYGCYLDASQRWQCRKFDTATEATKYSLNKPQLPMPHTRLVVVNPIVPESMHGLVLKRNLKCGVNIDYRPTEQ